MWPWEHLAIGYLVVSIWRHYRSGRPPREAEAIAVLVGSQLPDLVDKPLGWGTSVLPSGHSLAHSLPVAFSTSVAVYLISRRLDHGDVGVAFGLAYLFHLPADVIYPVFLGQSPAISFLFWPFVEQSASQTDALVGRVLELAAAFVDFLRTPRGMFYLVAELLFLLLTALVWRHDRYPGLGVLRPFSDR